MANHIWQCATALSGSDWRRTKPCFPCSPLTRWHVFYCRPLLMAGRYTRALVHPQLFTCAVLIWSSQGKSALPTYRLFAADVGVACSAGTHRHTQAYVKPSNEICNVVISFLSFKGGIERREGLGLYYHTPWREGQGHGSRKGLLKETRGGVANV